MIEFRCFEGGWMEFFVTCGSGLETFALLELKEVLDIIPTEPQSHPGKIFFKTVSSSTTLADSDIITQLIKNLKTVERLFGVISSTGKDATRVYQSGHELLNNLFKLSSGSEVKEKLEKWKLARANVSRVFIFSYLKSNKTNLELCPELCIIWFS